MSRGSTTTAPQGVSKATSPGGGPLSLDELRQLAAAAAPLAPEDVPPDRLAEAAAFNGVVARFRELVVAARNRVVMGRPVPAELGFELRALSEALPGERRRAAAAPDGGERPA